MIAPAPAAVPLRLTALTHAPRHRVVADLTARLNDLGWILDFHQFSNLALSVQFEVAPRQVPAVRSALASVPMHLSGQSQAAIAAIESVPLADLPDPVPASIHVTFLHGEPDLRIPVPAVPG